MLNKPVSFYGILAYTYVTFHFDFTENTVLDETIIYGMQFENITFARTESSQLYTRNHYYVLKLAILKSINSPSTLIYHWQ